MGIASGTSGSTAVVSGQIIEPQSGSILSGYDTDGYVSKTGYVSNPNSHGATYIETGFTSYAYS